MNEAGLIVLHSDWLPLFADVTLEPRHVMQLEPFVGGFFACQTFARSSSCVEADFDQDPLNGPTMENFWRERFLGSFFLTIIMKRE